MKLFEQISALRRSQTEKAVVDRRGLWKQYREILQRAGKPKPGDEARVLELAQSLGIPLEEVELHAVVLEEVKRLSSRETELEQTRGQLQQLETTMADTRAEFERLRLKSEEEGNRWQEVSLALSGLTAEIEPLATLTMQYPGLLREEDGEQVPADVMRKHSTPAVLEARKRLGL